MHILLHGKTLPRDPESQSIVDEVNGIAKRGSEKIDPNRV